MLTDAVARIARQPLLHRVRRWLGQPERTPGKLGLVLSGGGARGAYQAGVLAYIGEFFPETRFPIITGVSAGAINSAQLAQHVGGIGSAVQDLAESWRGIEAQAVYEPKSLFQMARRLFWNRDISHMSEEQLREGSHALADTSPLREYLIGALRASPEGRLVGIEDNLRRGALEAYAVITTNYATGQAVVFIEGEKKERWKRADRLSVKAELTVDHIMASTALPLIFPAVRLGDAWYGDGGISLNAPLAPALHLGADHLLAIATRYPRSRREADQPQILGYPPLAQILGLMLGSVFNDTLDQDVEMTTRLNHLLEKLPASERGLLRPVKLCVIRPSRDIAHMARAYEVKLEGFLNFLTTSLGSAETRSPEWLSMILFQREYVEQLMEVGYEDAETNHDQLEAFFADAAGVAPPRKGVRLSRGLVEADLRLPQPSGLPAADILRQFNAPPEPEPEAAEPPPEALGAVGGDATDPSAASTPEGERG